MLQHNGKTLVVSEGLALKVVPAVEKLAVGLHLVAHAWEGTLAVMHKATHALEAVSGQLERAADIGARWLQRAEEAQRAERCARCAAFGFVAMCLAAGAAGVWVGRVWDVYAICCAGASTHGGGWWGWFGPSWLRPALDALRVCSCCLQQLGMWALGMMALLRVVVPRALAGQRGGSTLVMVDVVLTQMLVQGALGALLMDSLGASWLAWLLLWQGWCLLQVLLQCVALPAWQQHAVELLLALVLPLCAAVLPFHPRFVHWGNGLLPRLVGFASTRVASRFRSLF